MTLHEKLAVMSGLSVQLLESTDKLNAHIAAIEEQFRTAHPMVRAFVQVLPDWCVGFGKVKNGWCFIAKHTEAPDSEADKLSSAPREVRVAACHHFNELAVALVLAMSNQQLEIQNILNGPMPAAVTTPRVETTSVVNGIECELCGGVGNSVAMSHKDGCPEIR